MKVVYAVAEGEYSDYSIRSIWTTKELAEALINRLKAADYNYDGRVEEYDLNDEDIKGKTGYICCFTKKLALIEAENYGPADACTGQAWQVDTGWNIYVATRRGKQVAIKIARDKIGQAQAKLEGIT